MVPVDPTKEPRLGKELKRGGGYVELGNHVVVCNFGPDVTALFVVLRDGEVLEMRTGLLVVVVGRAVVEVGVGCVWVIESTLWGIPSFSVR